MQEFEPVQPERFDRDNIVHAIEKLIDRCRDGEEIYADAAKHVQDRGLVVGTGSTFRPFASGGSSMGWGCPG